MNILKTVGTVLALLGLSAMARAKDEKPSISVAGYMEGYYEYSFNQPRTGATPNNLFRYYDAYSNSITLNLAELTLKAKADDKTEMLVDLDFGSFADLNASSETTTRNIGQAYIKYKPAESWVFQFGKMYTPLGFETVKAKDNWNYSRSALFSYGLPFWHVGASLGYEFTPGDFGVTGYVFNNWNSSYDANSSKTLAVQIHKNVGPTVLTYNLISGPEQSASESNMRTVHDFNVVWTLNPSLQFALDTVYGTEGGTTGRWYGGQLSAKWQTTHAFFLSPRVEYYRDDTGATLSSVAQTLKTYTLTEGLLLSKSLELRFEEKMDDSSEAVFTDAAGSSKRNQVTLLTALILNIE